MSRRQSVEAERAARALPVHARLPASVAPNSWPATVRSPALRAIRPDRYCGHASEDRQFKHQPRLSDTCAAGDDEAHAVLTFQLRKKSILVLHRDAHWRRTNRDVFAAAVGGQ